MRRAAQNALDKDLWYVGISPRKSIADRIKKHFSKEGATAFTRRNRPTSIELLWPAATPAAEAFVYYALLEAFGASVVYENRLAGWTQTATEVTSLEHLLADREARMLQDRCLTCGLKGYYADVMK